jgi:hypothetical protein
MNRGEDEKPSQPALRAEFPHLARCPNAVSRIYVGFHFRDAVETGTDHGEKIGNRAVNHFLRPAN